MIKLNGWNSICSTGDGCPPACSVLAAQTKSVTDSYNYDDYPGAYEDPQCPNKDQMNMFCDSYGWVYKEPGITTTTEVGQPSSQNPYYDQQNQPWNKVIRYTNTGTSTNWSDNECFWEGEADICPYFNACGVYSSDEEYTGTADIGRCFETTVTGVGTAEITVDMSCPKYECTDPSQYGDDCGSIDFVGCQNGGTATLSDGIDTCASREASALRTRHKGKSLPSAWSPICGEWPSANQYDLSFTYSSSYPEVCNQTYSCNGADLVGDGTPVKRNCYSYRVNDASNMLVRWAFTGEYKTVVVCAYSVRIRTRTDAAGIVTVQGITKSQTISTFSIPDTANVTGTSCSDGTLTYTDEFTLEDVGTTVPDDSGPTYPEHTVDTISGVAIIGTSKQSGFTPPRYKWSGAVFDCRAQQGKYCPYATIDELNPKTSAEVTSANYTFNNVLNINTCNAP